MKKYSVESIAEELRQLGLCLGDTVFVKADLMKVGYIKDAPRSGLLEALLRVIGSEGTLVISAFTESYFLPTLRPEHCFTAETLPNSGALARLIVQRPDAKRSAHPTNSFAAIGPKSDYILEGHDALSPSYLPIQKLIDKPSKCLSIGCVESSPGFTTTHWAQYLLNQSTQNVFSGLVGAYYMKDGVRNVFKRRDIGGHNPGAYKLYAHYVNKGLLRTGFVGDTYAVLGDTDALYKVDYEVMKDHPRYILCSDPQCFDCRATWWYNKRDMPRYFLWSFPKKLFKKFVLKFKKS